jgi:hypothetical protein
MWLYTRYGFFSAVCARKVVDGQVSGDIDPDRVMIRARNREHLDKLKEKFSDVIGDPDIHTGVGTDYRHRIFIDHSQWVDLAGRLARDIDYGNFKDSASDNGMDSAYVGLLSDIWNESYSYQSDPQHN